MIAAKSVADFGYPMSNRQGSGQFRAEGGFRLPSEQQMIAAKSVADFGSPMSNRQGSGQFRGEGGLRSPSEQQRMIADQFMGAFGSPVSDRQGSGQFGQGYCSSPGSHEREDLVSKKIFVTFRPKSSFTNEDVSTYFSKFGEVKCVDLPKHQEGKFGFVTFTNAETVRTILDEENSHVIGDSVVWVKGY
ncbi:PREDICTED: zinc finger CCCH domain-containing protein 55-like isoform X2 [Camelina sativa]|nr:PREDICTED: zinc finger CCCH domain-containing protein 55-like isoform X2 [Camelina sativa]XP_019091307.1 PREDICTED: zinc finger CCCH domain-containing protein 55-like isoform X2 [Camelina sativa]